MGILAATSTILAVTQRLRGEIKESKQTTTALICLFRAVGSTAIFLSLAILTPPGPTCLFPNPDPSAKEGSIIPRYTNACVCTTLVVVFSALTHKFNFVTDSKNEPDVAGEPHIPPGPDAEAGMAGAGDQDHPANDANLDHNGINDHHHEDLLEPLVPQPEAGPPEPPLQGDSNPRNQS